MNVSVYVTQYKCLGRDKCMVWLFIQKHRDKHTEPWVEKCSSAACEHCLQELLNIAANRWLLVNTACCKV